MAKHGRADTSRGTGPATVVQADAPPLLSNCGNRACDVSMLSTGVTSDHHRARGRIGLEKSSMMLAQLDASFRKKRSPRGEDYRVRPANQPVRSQSPSYHPATVQTPLNSVDKTVMTPPDADGNPYNSPAWKAAV